MINFLIEAGASLFDSVLGIWFVDKFCKAEPRWFIKASGIAAMFAFTMFSDRFMPSFNLLAIAIMILILIAYGAYVSRKIGFRQLFAPILFFVSLMAISSILFSTMSSLTENFEELLYGSDTTIRYLQLILHKIILFSVLKLILSFLALDGKISKLNAILTFSISLSTIFGLAATMFVATIKDSGVGMTQITIIAGAFVLTNIILYIMLSQIQRLQKSEYELRLLQEKTEYENARYEDAAAMWQQIRALKHDMKQHLSVISAQLDTGDVESSRKYLDELLPSLDMAGRIIRSDNKTLDYIINTKLSNLENTQIVISGSIGDISDVADKDLASLMGNILDNAVEAIADLKEKRIELHFSVENESRMIICKNTVKESVLKNNPGLRTTKKDRSAHGYGHKIVENIVKEYGGMIDYFEESDLFGVQIMLPRKSES